MKKNSSKEYLNRDEVNEMIESAIRRHNRRSTIISSLLGWIPNRGDSLDFFKQYKTSNEDLPLTRTSKMID